MRGRRKARLRKQAAREEVRATLNSIVTGSLDAYEGYRKLFVIYCSNNEALEEIKPMFRIPGIDPDGVFSVTPEFRLKVKMLAQELLPLISD